MARAKVYLNSRCKNAAVNAQIQKILCEEGFEVYSPCKKSARDESNLQIFRRNVQHIRKADLMVVVLKDYGKDTAAELGIAYGLGVPRIGIDFDAEPADIMVFYAVDQLIQLERLKETVSSCLKYWARVSFHLSIRLRRGVLRGFQDRCRNPISFNELHRSSRSVDVTIRSSEV